MMNDAMERQINRIFYAAPFVTDLGIEMDNFEAGVCTTCIHLKPRHLQQDGFVHAGVQAAIADHTAGTAAATLMQSNQQVLTVEFKISFLRPAQGYQLRCTAKIIKPGRRLSFAESEVFCLQDGPPRLTAKATVTLAHVNPPQA